MNNKPIYAKPIIEGKLARFYAAYLDYYEKCKCNGDCIGPGLEIWGDGSGRIMRTRNPNEYLEDARKVFEFDEITNQVIADLCKLTENFNV